jgi:hypothetical protein
MTVVEILVGLVVAIFLLGGLTGLFIGEARLFGEWESKRTARDVVRSATQILASDLRRLDSSGGVESASSSAITLRVPYTVGLVCSSTAGATVVSLIPTDSVMVAASSVSGQAVRTNTGYAYTNVTAVAAALAAPCTAANITTVTGGRVVSVTPGAGVNVRAGTVLFLYQRVLYEFQAVSGGTRLTRRLLSGLGTTENLAQTFLPAGTRFRFFVGSSSTAQDAAPADLTTLRGIELALEGKGEYGALGAGSPTSEAAQAVFFRNPPN